MYVMYVYFCICCLHEAFGIILLCEHTFSYLDRWAQNLNSSFLYACSRFHNIL